MDNKITKEYKCYNEKLWTYKDDKCTVSEVKMVIPHYYNIILTVVKDFLPDEFDRPTWNAYIVIEGACSNEVRNFWNDMSSGWYTEEYAKEWCCEAFLRKLESFKVEFEDNFELIKRNVGNVEIKGFKSIV